MKQRLQTLLATEKLASSKFADLLGVNRSSISHLLSGRNNPSLEFLQKILVKFPHINPDWLLLGQGEMYRNQPQNNVKKPVEGQLFGEDIPTENQEKPLVSNTQESAMETSPNLPLNNKTQETKVSHIQKDEEKVLKEPEDRPVYTQNTTPELNAAQAKEASPSSSKKIEKIVFFYTDHSFDTYYPNS
jgi:transcriptional regulator with XRE-family HTH domain